MALSYGLSLNMMFVRSVQKQCSLENNMHIPSEAPEVIEGNRLTTNWPAVGKVEIQDLQVRYGSNVPLVLCGISCTFEGGHKIGIFGRTGSGKTTLIISLFRLVEPAWGKIIVDGIDISTIGLHDLRSRFGIIPQDPTFFNGTVRYNSDPLSQHSDQEIWAEATQHNLRPKAKNLYGAFNMIPTVMDCTMVLAISDGTLVEYDEPVKLMTTEGTLFGQLCHGILV
uniref:ABC transporter domain-containing protein n=2 Tax=Quercus lobata TaxID=97700 RepID=A0A7N2MJI6_QUELO